MNERIITWLGEFSAPFSKFCELDISLVSLQNVAVVGGVEVTEHVSDVLQIQGTSASNGWDARVFYLNSYISSEHVGGGGVSAHVSDVLLVVGRPVQRRGVVVDAAPWIRPTLG